MVAQHYRWDFIGLSTDTKPDSSNPKVADGSTFYESNTSKLYVWYKDQWYEKTAGGSYELPVASADTLGGVKVGDGLSITEAGVLSASGGGEAGAMKELTSADYNYPEDNPDGIASWLLPAGTYTTEYGTKVYYSKTTNYNYNYPMVIIPVSVKPNSNETRTLFFSFDANHVGYQDTVDGADAGFYKF